MQSEMVAGGPPANATPPIVNCPLCTGQHRLSKCELMKAKSPEERKSFVRQVRLCDNCFASGHMAMDCRSKMRCQVNGCGWKHHTMLHVQKKKYDCGSSPVDPPATSGETGTSTASGPSKTRTSTVSGARETGQCSATCSGKNNVCLRTVPVIVRGKGELDQIMTNALLDPGSDVTLCDVSLMDKLQLVGQPKQFSLATVNGESDSRKGSSCLCVSAGCRWTRKLHWIKSGRLILCIFLKAVHQLKTQLNGLI